MWVWKCFQIIKKDEQKIFDFIEFESTVRVTQVSLIAFPQSYVSQLFKPLYETHKIYQ